MAIVTRFAPSPTGFLHIGGARTALFNYLYAKHKGGKFLLRIEDTDRKRSTDEAVGAILDGLIWLGLDWDDEEYYQFARLDRHKEVVQELLDSGQAYYCYSSKEEIESARQQAKDEKRSFRFMSPWRDKPLEDAPNDAEPAVRLKAPIEGETVIEDQVQGRVVIANDQLDDMVLLRSDGTPTYMLAVVVDDHDMEVTHIIRGDDHLTNSFRQKLIYQSLQWSIPEFSHIPLIHGQDGAKLSKRHGALGIDEYQKMGYLPEAIRNYLLRLGWSHGDDEIISDEDAVKWFDLDHIGKSPSRFDFTKLDNLNGHYIKEADNERLFGLVQGYIAAEVGREITDADKDIILRGLDGLKVRAKNLNDLAESAVFYIRRPLQYTEKAEKTLAGSKNVLDEVNKIFAEFNGDWTREKLEEQMRALSENMQIGLGKIMAPIRAVITGSHVSPSMFEVMEVLGREESLARLARE